MKVKKAVILIAGMGTRFLPITKSIPKEMLPIIDTPIIHYIVEEAYQSGIEEILFITSSYKKSVEDYFDINYELESRLKNTNKINLLSKIENTNNMCKVYYIRQGEPLGTAHAISLAEGFIKDEPFAVLFGDNLIKSKKPALKQLIEMHQKYDSNIIGVQEVLESNIDKYGIVNCNEKLLVTQIIEKPEIGSVNSKLAALGRYVFKPQIFNELKKVKKTNGEYYLTDAIATLMKKQNFHACVISGECYDTGNQLGFLEANLAYAFDNYDYKRHLLNFIEKIK